jgi:hypothetical protein
VIGKYEAYLDQYHVTAAYAQFLSGVLAMSLHLPSSGLSHVRPTTSVVAPSSGTTVSGSRVLVAKASSNVTSVTFELSGGSLSHHVISESTKTLYGWISKWNTTSVPNGTYTLQSVAGTNTKTSATSAGSTITVSNPDTSQP